MTEESRLDRLWRAVAETDADQDWMRFYEGFAAARLFVPLEGEAGETARPKTVTLATGAVALAFDSEARFSAFIDGPTDFAALTGAELARALAPLGVQVALNPGVSPCETVLDAGALGWIAKAAGAEVAVEETRLRLAPPAAPDPALLEALATRIADMGDSVAEAWLAAPEGQDGDLCVLRLSAAAAALTGEIAGEITRIGQLRSDRAFAVAVADGETRLLAEARRVGIGLAGHPQADE
ncbi:MAG TPA: SseB family protein [Thermohalobaculum sp.]|nr:SseB family protein [Thermohalobaculum sp.]